MAARFTKHLRSLLVKNQSPFGDVFPPKENPQALAIDGRTAALRVLREYICNQIFFREMGPGQHSKPFTIPLEQFEIEQPDTNKDQVSPSLAVVPGDHADYDNLGLGVYLEEETRDLYAVGTVLMVLCEYNEKIRLEIQSDYKSVRRGLFSALETCLSPTELMSGVRFKMPEYYDELVCFTLMTRGLGEDAGSARNRRKGWLEIEMRFNVVALVNYLPFEPSVQVNTDVSQPYGVNVVLDAFGNTRAVPGNE